VHLQLLAEKTGLADELARAGRSWWIWPVLGAVAIGDIAVLEHERTVLGPVASAATVRRTLDEVGELPQRRIAAARAAVRRGANFLEERPEVFPGTVVDGQPPEGWTVLDSDAIPAACASE
jgi:hypothetical protein